MRPRIPKVAAQQGCAFALGGLAGALLVAVIAPQSTQWINTLTAMGTIGAVIVALWAALWGRHVQTEQAKDRAGLYAAYIAAKLERYVDALQTATACAYFDDLAHHTPRFLHFKRSLNTATTDISLDMLANLIPVDGRAAHRLARGLALVEEVQRVVALEAAHEDESGGAYQVSDDRTLELGGQLSAAVDLMRVALGEFYAWAARYAKTPTAEEVYGE